MILVGAVEGPVFLVFCLISFWAQNQWTSFYFYPSFQKSHSVPVNLVSCAMHYHIIYILYFYTSILSYFFHTFWETLSVLVNLVLRSALLDQELFPAKFSDAEVNYSLIAANAIRCIARFFFAFFHNFLQKKTYSQVFRH